MDTHCYRQLAIIALLILHGTVVTLKKGHSSTLWFLLDQHLQFLMLFPYLQSVLEQPLWPKCLCFVLGDMAPLGNVHKIQVWGVDDAINPTEAPHHYCRGKTKLSYFPDVFCKHGCRFLRHSCEFLMADLRQGKQQFLHRTLQVFIKLFCSGYKALRMGELLLSSCPTQIKIISGNKSIVEKFPGAHSAFVPATSLAVQQKQGQRGFCHTSEIIGADTNKLQ